MRWTGFLAAICSWAVSGILPTGRCSSRALPVAVRSWMRRASCRSCARSIFPVAGGSADLVVVAVHGRGSPTVQERLGAASQDARRVVRGLRAGPRGASRTSFAYRSASVRWRAATSTTDALWREPDVERIERLTLIAEKTAKTIRIAAIGLRLRAENGLRAAALPGSANPAHAHRTTSVVRMPAMKWPAMLQKRTYRPGRSWTWAVRTEPGVAGSSERAMIGVSFSSFAVKPSGPQRQARGRRADDDQLVVVGALVGDRHGQVAARDVLRGGDAEIALGDAELR